MTLPTTIIAMRSISACAEVPQHHACTSRCAWVYLRVCGGTFFEAFFVKVGEGLSPRVRRYLPPCGSARQATGSISACAEVPGRELGV